MKGVGLRVGWPLAAAVGMALSCLAGAASAEDIDGAEALFLGDIVPVGHWGARLETRYLTIDQYYNNKGHRESLTADLDGVALDAGTIPLLAAFGPGATLGTVDLQGRLEGLRHRLTVGYGLTPNLSVGAIIPFGILKTRVGHFAIQGGNLALNPAFDPGQPIGTSNPPVVPVGTLGTTEPVGTEGVQELISNPIYGYAYERFESTQTSGLLDPSIGLRWRFYHGRQDSAYFTPSIRVGMTKQDDPDNLVDAQLDDGSNDLVLELGYSRLLGLGWDLRLQAKYTQQRPDKVTARVHGVNETLVPASRKEHVRRDLGDALESGVEGGYRSGDWRAHLALEFLRRGQDHYHSAKGSDVAGLEEDTRRSSDMWRLGVDWNGMRAWREGRLPLPLFVSVDVRRIYRATNVVDARDLFLTVTALF